MTEYPDRCNTCFFRPTSVWKDDPATENCWCWKWTNKPDIDGCKYYIEDAAVIELRKKGA